MIRCKSGEDLCPEGKNICCLTCGTFPCEGCCDRLDYIDCTCAEQIEETTDLTLFQSKAMAIMQEIANLDRMKKELDAKDKVVRQELQEAMDKYGIKKFENDILKVTYVEPTTRTTIDSKRLKEELPAIAEKYTKVSQVKGSVRIDVK